MQASSAAAVQAAEVAARVDSSSQAQAVELLAQKEALEGHRAELEARIAALRSEHEAAVRHAKASAAGEVAVVQGELQVRQAAHGPSCSAPPAAHPLRPLPQALLPSPLPQPRA